MKFSVDLCWGSEDEEKRCSVWKRGKQHEMAWKWVKRAEDGSNRAKNRKEPSKTH